MRIRSDGAITGMVGLGPLWRWMPGDDRPVLLGVNGGAACWHGNDMIAVISEPMVGIVRFGVNGGYSVVDPRIPNDLQAAGDHWLASSAAPRKTWGYLRGGPFFYDGVSVIALDADGSYVIAGEATNFRHVIVWGNGHEVTLPYGEGIVRLKDGIAMGRANNRITLHTPNGRLPTSSNRADRGTIQVIPGETWPIMAFLSPQAFWLMYSHETMGIVLHPTDSAKWGRRWTTPMHGIDVKVEGSDLLMAWATQEGDRADAARRVTIPLGKLLDDDLTPVLPQPSVVAPAGPVVMAGAFFTTAATPGNASVWVRGPLPINKAVFAPVELVDQVPAEYLAGLWIAHVPRTSTVPEIPLDQRIAQSRPVAERLKVPMLVYDDRRVYRTTEIRAWCGSTPWIACPQWYLSAGEDPAHFVKDVSTHLAGLDKVPLMPAIRCYTSMVLAEDGTRTDTVSVSQVQAAMNALAQSSRVDGFFLFAWDRADGVIGTPALRPWADAWLATSTTLRPANAREWAATFFLKETVPMKLPANVWTRIQRFAEAYPPPQGDPGEAHEERCRVWTRCLCEQIRAEFGSEWGWKRASATRPPSKETLARQSSGKIEGWDLLTGASTGHPTLSTDPGYHDLVAEGNQVFIPVEPINRLTRRSVRPELPTWVGVSAFDLGARLEAGDRRWLDDYAVGFGVLRVMVARQSGPTPRTLIQGRAQLRLVLNALRVTGQKASVVLCCDTKGMSRETLTDHVRQCNVIMATYPDCIAAVEIGNENWYTQYQSSDLVDIDFMESLEALIDMRFPVAWGGDYEGGSFATFHSDRGTTPEDNGVIMRRREESSGKDYVDDEPLGITEPDRVAGRQRTADPEYARRLAVAANVNGLGGVTLHTDAGLTCNLDEVGPIHREARRRFLAEFPTTVTPPVPPVPTGHPILDAPLSPLDPVGYKFYIANAPAIDEEAVAWYLRFSGGRPPVPADIFHMRYRAIAEGNRWKTLRTAWTEDKPGGAPK